MVYTIGRPTRPPGKYTVVWDGKDDRGKPLPAGTYTVFIEAAREHGTHQIIRKQVTIADEPFAEELKGNVEIKSASIEYRRKAAARLSHPARARPSPRRPAVRRRLGIRFAAWSRWLHIYLSMFGLAAVLFFSVTGLTLNHPDWFFAGAEHRDRGRGPGRPAPGCTGDAPAAPTPRRPGDAGRQAGGRRAPPAASTASAGPGRVPRRRYECFVTFKGPGYAADAFIDRETGRYTADADLARAASPC